VSIILVFSLLSSLFIHEYGKWIMTTDPVYENFIKSSFYLRWFVLFLIFLTVVNQLWIDKHLLEQRNSFNRLIEKEKLLAKAEMNNLQQQFQPHFLFNSLNSINALVKSEPDQARQMIHNLSDYLRLTIQKGKEELIPLKEEMDYLNLYLEIEKVRFGHRLKINSSVDPICSDMMLPSLILQPIVENAIKYGVYGSIGELSIDISIRCQNNALIIAITNPYDETAVSSSKGTGFGLESIQRKLALVYKRMDLLKTAKTATQFETTLFIPQK
jgi:LytS/YehU family sensor histidine kinase